MTRPFGIQSDPVIFDIYYISIFLSFLLNVWTADLFFLFNYFIVFLFVFGSCAEITQYTIYVHVLYMCNHSMCLHRFLCHFLCLYVCVAKQNNYPIWVTNTHVSLLIWKVRLCVFLLAKEIKLTLVCWNQREHHILIVKYVELQLVVFSRMIKILPYKHNKDINFTTTLQIQCAAFWLSATQRAWPTWL